jgi:hypothetical protein
MARNAARPRARGATQSQLNDTPSVHRLSEPVKSASASPTLAPGNASALQMELRAELNAALAPLFELVEEIGGQRASDTTDLQGLCREFCISSPTARKLILEGKIPFFSLGEQRRFSITACKKALEARESQKGGDK